MNLTDQQIENFPIQQYLENHKLDYREISNSYILDKCLKCFRENKFYIHKEGKYFSCWVCGVKGSLVQLISLIDKVSYEIAYQLITGVRIYTPFEVKSRLEVEEEVSDNPVIELPKYFKSIDLGIGEEEARYLERREIDQELVDLFQIKYDEYQQRVIFPIGNRDGGVVGWQARDITDRHPIKILTKPNGLKKSKLLYNFHRIINDGEITIVEGPVDCIKAYQNNPVALFGKQISNYQLSLILSLSNLKRVNIGLDPDAKEEIYKLGSILSPAFEVYIISLPSGKKDLGDCSVEEANQAIRNGIPFFNLIQPIQSNL